eukprot:48006-Eustigmatos_ZCMA.PRE.1
MEFPGGVSAMHNNIVRSLSLEGLQETLKLRWLCHKLQTFVDKWTGIIMHQHMHIGGHSDQRKRKCSRADLEQERMQAL